MKINNKNVLILFAARGIGFYLSKLYSLHGARVIMIDSSINKLNKYSFLINKSLQSNRVSSFACNFYNIEQCKSLNKYFLINYNKIDIIINNYSIFNDLTNLVSFSNSYLFYYLSFYNFFSSFLTFFNFNNSLYFLNLLTGLKIEGKKNKKYFLFLKKNISIFTSFFLNFSKFKEKKIIETRKIFLNFNEFNNFSYKEMECKIFDLLKPIIYYSLNYD